MNKFEIEALLYKTKDYSKIKELLKNSNESWSFNILAKIYMQEKNFNEAYNCYYLAQNTQGCGYTKFIQGDIKQAEIIMTTIRNSSPLVNWILFLIEILNNKKDTLPTYFQIRNFYEQDLEMLFCANQKDMINRIVNKNTYLEKFNREIYKYTARVLTNNNEYEWAKKFLKKSIDICYKDPETHFMLASIYEQDNQKEKAIIEFRKSIEVVNGYLPAEKRLNNLLK